MAAGQPSSVFFVPRSVVQLPVEGEELDTRDVVSLSDLRANDESDDECRVYLIGRRSSPNVSRYRDFLARNLVPSRG